MKLKEPSQAIGNHQRGASKAENGWHEICGVPLVQQDLKTNAVHNVLTLQERLDMNQILLKGGRVIDPANNRDGKFDVLIEGTSIRAIDTSIETTDEIEVIDCSGKLVLPGLIDTH